MWTQKEESPLLFKSKEIGRKMIKGKLFIK